MKTSCAVRGLAWGDCSQHADSLRTDGLCSYHGKLEDGVTVPPGADLDGPVTEPKLHSTARRAAFSYQESTHPHFAHLVDTGGTRARTVSAAA